MGMHPASPALLPDGVTEVFFGPSLPTAAGEGSFNLGDLYLLIPDPASSVTGKGGLYRCITAGTGATAVWQAVAQSTRNIVSKAGAYTATLADDVIILTANAAITLPAAAGAVGHVFEVKRVGAANGTVVAASLEAGTTATFGTDLAVVRVISDGTKYHVIGTYGTVNLT